MSSAHITLHEVSPDELVQVERGLRRTLIAKTGRWLPGTYIVLHDGDKRGRLAEILEVTVQGGARHVRFAPVDSLATGDTPRFLSNGWPDYTTDKRFAMDEEPEPVSDTDAQLVERARWERMARLV